MDVDTTPRVLMIGGHDPTGGAGLVADVETAAAFGCRALSLVTALTVQDTRGVTRFEPVDPALLREQGERLLMDLKPNAVKIGMLASVDIAQVVVDLLKNCGGAQVVVDPVLASGAGDPLADDRLCSVIRDQIAPKCTLMTPNRRELLSLYEPPAMPDCATLVTGTDSEAHGPVVHELHQPGAVLLRWRWRRLAGGYHGSGCTLASAAASRLAQGAALIDAVQDAQAYTWETLARARDRGRGQWLPLRGPAKMFIAEGRRGQIG